MDAKTLRASILQMAIEGKLVPQLDEEPAVEQIGDAPEEVPFEIPGKWQFVELGKIVDVRDGTHATPAYVTDGIPFITSKNLKNGCLDFSNAKFISITDHLEFSKRSKVSPGDILFPMIGTVGNPVVVPNNISEFSIKNMALFKKQSQSHVDFSFLFFLLKAFESRVNSQASGGVQKFVSLKFLRTLVVPLPPLSEQRRIVARLNKLLPLVDKFGKAQEALAVAQKEFPEKLKASLLQEAIQGKLVPQLDEEPAVEQIGEAPKDVPFAIPEKWKWEQLDSIFTFIDYRGKTPTKTTSGIRLMTASNVRAGYIDHTRVEYISVEEFEQRKSRGISHKGDILFTTEAPLGFAALADLDTYSAGQRVITLQTNSQTVNTLFVFFLLSPYFQKELRNQATGTTAQGIKAARLKKMWLPVPPLNEQRRIVARLNELLPLVDRMAAQATADK